MKNDVLWANTLPRLMDPAGNSWGAWETKDDFIKDLQNKTNKWKSGDISDVQVATFGSNTAVSHYMFTYNAELQGTHRGYGLTPAATPGAERFRTWKTEL